MKLKKLMKYFENQNANTFTSKEIVDENFTFHPQLEDKFLKIYDMISSYNDTIIYGARGIGKTLFLKKLKFNLLDELVDNANENREEKILPIFFDLTLLREYEKLLTEKSIANQNILIDYYLKYNLISELINTLVYIQDKETTLISPLSDFIRKFIRINIPNTTSSLELLNEIQERQKDLEKPFHEINIDTNLKIVIPVDNNVILDTLNQQFKEILNMIITETSIGKFLIIFDEFSMLNEQMQNLMASIIIEMKKSITEICRFKISVMSGRFHVDKENYDFTNEGFNDIYFEIQLMHIFSGSSDNDKRLELFYSYIFENRTSCKVEEVFKGNCFSNLCKFSSFKIRDFLNFIKDICIKHSGKENITENMIYNTCSPYYRGIIAALQEDSTYGSYIPLIEAYLGNIFYKLKNYSRNLFYFVDMDVPDEIVKTLIYFKILSFVSFRKPSEGIGKFGRGYLIDLSTALLYQHIKKRDIPAIKYLNFSNAKEITQEISAIQIKQLKKLLKEGISEEKIIDILEIPASALLRIDNNGDKKQLLLSELIREKDNYYDFKDYYNSEALIKVDSLVKRDREIEEEIQKWVEIRYISTNLAKELVLINIEFSSSIVNNKFVWDLTKKEEIKSQLSQQYRATFTRAYNLLNNV